MLGHRLLPGDLGHDRRTPGEEIRKRFDDLDARECRARRIAAARTRQRADDPHAAFALERRHEVAGDAAPADQPDGGHSVHYGLRRMPVNFHCDSSSMA